MSPGSDEPPPSGAASDPAAPAAEPGAWQRFIDLRNAAQARGIDIDMRQPGARPLRTGTSPRWGRPVGQGAAAVSRRGGGTFLLVLAVGAAVSVLFVVVVALAG